MSPPRACGLHTSGSRVEVSGGLLSTWRYTRGGEAADILFDRTTNSPGLARATSQGETPGHPTQTSTANGVGACASEWQVLPALVPHYR